MICPFNKPRVQAVAVNDSQSAHDLWRAHRARRWAEDLAHHIDRQRFLSAWSKVPMVYR